MAVAGQLGEALSGLVGRHRSVVDLTADLPLKHGRVDEGGFGVRVTRRVAARAVFDEHALDALAGNVRQLVLVDEGHLGVLRLLRFGEYAAEQQGGDKQRTEDAVHEPLSFGWRMQDQAPACERRSHSSKPMRPRREPLRSTHSSGVSPSTSTSWSVPLIFNVKAMDASRWLGLIGRSRPTWTAVGRLRGSMGARPYGRTRMIVFPLRRSVGFKAATASSRVETLPMFVRSRPSRTRWTISLSWARSDSTTKSTAKPSAGRASAGPTMDTSVPPARMRPADRFRMSPPMTSNTRSMPPTSSSASLSRSTNSCAPKSSAF